MSNVLIEELKQTPVGRRHVEMVEHKATDYPDTICDAGMEQISIALCREYIATFGHILHYNVDKCLLVAGLTQPHLGGGSVIEPMRLILGDRATTA